MLKSEEHQIIINKIQEDFYYFISNETTLNHLEIKIQDSPLKIDKKKWYLGRTRMAHVYQLSRRKRLYEYRKERKSADLIVNFAEKKVAELYSQDANLIYEIIYILILSLSGEFLDAKGLMRLHALGIRDHQQTNVFWGFRGSGKSTLFTCLNQNLVDSFYSDEICLFDLLDKKLKPFPVRIAVNDETLVRVDKSLQISKLQRTFLDSKNTYSFPKEKIAIEDDLGCFIQLGSYGKANKMQKMNFIYKTKLFTAIVLGVGLIQMVEFVLRVSNFGVLIKIFINRIKLLCFLHQQSLLYWQRSGILDQDIRFIIEFIRGSRKK